MFEVYRVLGNQDSATFQEACQDRRTVRYALEKLNFPYVRAQLPAKIYPTMAKLTKQLPSQEIFGYFYDDEHYYKVMQLMTLATNETRYRLFFFLKYIVANLNVIKVKAACDIGSGHHTKLSRLLSRYAENITFIDSNEYALQNAVCAQRSHHRPIALINSQVHELELSVQKYDLIALSHVLYHYDLSQQIELVQQAYHALNSGGKLVVVLTSGLDKDAIIEKFSGKLQEPKMLFDACARQLDGKLKVYYTSNILSAPNVAVLAHLAGLWLYDGGVFVTRNDLYQCLEAYQVHEGNYQLCTNQNFLVLTKP